MFQFARNVSFCAVDVGEMTVEKPELIRKSLEPVLDLFGQGLLRMPFPMKSFPVSDIESAFRYLQTGTNAGKVVVEVDDDDVVPVSNRFHLTPKGQDPLRVTLFF